MKKINRIALVLALSLVMVMCAAFASSAASDSFKMTKCTSSSFTVSWNFTIPSYAMGDELISTITKVEIYNKSGDKVYTKSYADSDELLTSVSGTKTFSGKSTGYTNYYEAKCSYQYAYKSDIIDYPNNPEKWNVYNSSLYEYSYVNTLPKKISKSNFGISSTYGSTVSLRANIPADATGVQYKVYSVSSGKCVATKSKYSYSGDIDISKNKAYKYKVRSYYKNYSNDKKYYGAWSSYKYFDVGTASISSKSSVKGCKLKLKGVSKVSKYKIYVTTSSSSTKGTLTKTVSPKKIGKYSIYSLKKIGKSYMKKGKTYYINIHPVIKDSKGSHESDVYMHTSFYNYK